jgi:Tfp pilus assembly protein PilZ
MFQPPEEQIMIDSDSQFGKYGVTAHLFKLINDLPPHQQFALLRQLIGDNVSQHLFKLIIDMPENQQIALLEQMGMDQMEELPIADEPITTVRLEEAGNSIRENPRKSCLIKADYRVQDRQYKGYILDISIGGVFIETEENFSVGQKMMLSFHLPNQSEPFTLAGTIAWNGAKGFGLSFDQVSAQQHGQIKNFVDRPDRSPI